MKFFNIIRNISLVIVLLLITMLIYMAYKPAVRTGLKDYICDNNEALAQDSTIMETEEDSLKNTEEDFPEKTEEQFQMQEVPEQLPQLKEEKKYKIPVKGGFAYLQAIQIMHVQSGNAVELTTTSQVAIELNVTLTELEDLLNKSGEACFFRIKSAIINCNYVTQLVKESKKVGNIYSYQYVVTMQNGDRINVSEEMANQFFEILNNLSI